MRRLRIPLPAAGSTVGRDLSLFRFIESPPRCGPAGEKLIYVRSSGHLFCTNVRPKRVDDTTVGRLVGRWCQAWGNPACRKPQSTIGGMESVAWKGIS